MSAACVRCGKVARIAAKGLCWGCYRTPEQLARDADKRRERRAARRAFAADPDVRQPGDPTPEECEAFAAWWEAEQERLAARVEVPRVCRVEAK